MPSDELKAKIAEIKKKQKAQLEEARQAASNSTLKRGNFTKDEYDFLYDNFETLSDRQIANSLNRNLRLVRKFIAILKYLRKRHGAYQGEHVEKLHNRHYWESIRKNLMPNEISYFEAEWSALSEQFATHDILHTDEIMINDLIMSEVMLNRIMERKKSVLQQVKYVEALIEAEMNKDVSIRDSKIISDNRADFTNLQASLGSLNKEHNDLQQRKDILFKNLKSTREQRINKLEESKKDLFARIQLLDEKDSREKEGKWCAMLKLATEKERLKLEEYHTFEDQKVDRPLLTPEAVLRSIEEEKKND
jgi:hypothetical protein